MPYTTITAPTAGDVVRASFGSTVADNFEDHEDRIVDIEAILVDDGFTFWAEVALTSPQILALRATPITLVAAPGAGKVLEFVGGVLILDATATAYVESAANLAVRYTNGSGVKASQDIEATGFIDQTTDTMTTMQPRIDAIVAKSGCENAALVLHNIGAGEYTTGTGVLRVKVMYRVWTTAW
jgi:hypothetical protein